MEENHQGVDSNHNWEQQTKGKKKKLIKRMQNGLINNKESYQQW